MKVIPPHMKQDYDKATLNNIKNPYVMALYFLSEKTTPDTRIKHLYIDAGKGCDLIQFETDKGKIRILSVQNFSAPFYKLNIHRYLSINQKAVKNIMAAVELYLKHLTKPQMAIRA